jgi:hypothetical protein
MAHFTDGCTDEGFLVGFPPTCSAANDVDDVLDYVPGFVDAPPSVSTTPFPTTQDHTNDRSSVYFCAGHGPTMMPVASPTPYPTAKNEEKVWFYGSQVSF